jgi:multisubunit Na+/H+ antiporter MnhE subunit
MNPGVVFYFVLSAIRWFGLVGRPRVVDVLLGFAVIFGGWAFIRHVAGENYTVPLSRFLRSVGKISGLFMYQVLPAMIRGTWHVFRAILSLKQREVRPGVFTVQLPGASKEAVFLMSFAITLAPDAQVMDIDDENTLYIHVIDGSRIPEAENEAARMYESYVREALP